MPLYRQIAEDLSRQIKSGKLRPGQQLMSELELREEYAQDGRDVSRNTIRDAISVLIRSGLVATRPGQGTFVLRKVDPFVSKLNLDPLGGGVEDEVYQSEVEQGGRIPEESRPRVEVQRAPAVIASQLRVDEGSQVISRNQERWIDGTPWTLQTTFYPMDFVEKGANQLLMADNIQGGLVKYLEGKLGIKQVGFREWMTARTPTPEERTFFGLSDKVQVPILESQRTGFTEDGKPIRYTVTVYPADRNVLQLDIGPIPE